MTQELFDAQSALITAGAAWFTSEASRLTDDAPELAALCTQGATVCAALLLLTILDDATYDRRETTLTALTAHYEACCSQRLDARLAALEYHGVAIDLELVRFYLFGSEVVVASKL